MSEHRFTVYVGVNITERPENDERDDAEFAESVLWYTGQRECERTDGWADCVGTGWIAAVEYEESHG